MGVDVGVTDVRARADDEGGPELRDALATLLDAEAVAVGAARSLDAARVEEQRHEVHLLDSGRSRGSAFIVDQHRERYVLLDDEGLGIELVTRADGDDLRAL